MSPHKPAWMDEEEGRASALAATGKTQNASAPQLVRFSRAPPRKQKAFYIQEQHAAAFERLVFAQKQAKGKKAPELAEEAIELLLGQYGETL